MTEGDYQDPYDAPYPTQTPTAPTAPRLTGPITDPTDPRLTDGSYANDPNVLAFQNQQYGVGGVASQPGAVWDPVKNYWSLPAKAHDTDPGTTPDTGGQLPPPTPGPAGGPAPSPTVAPPLPTPPPAFHYDDFAPPDPNDLSSDPGFQFENAQGMQAIGARNAALGTLNTGGTLKDYVTFGQNLAHTRYGDLFNRKLTQYGTNRGNALDAYNTNYGTQVKDPWNESMQRASLDQNNNQFNASQDFNKWLENYKRSTLDPFDQKYKTLSLL